MSNDKLLEDSLDPKDEQIPDEDTRKTLEEMKAEGKEVPALDGEKPEEKPKEEPVKEEKIEESKGEKVDEQPKVDRIPKMMPAFKHKIAEKEWSKKEQSLLNEIEALKNKPNETMDEKIKINDDIDDKVKKLAEDKGVDADLIKSIIGLVPRQGLSEKDKKSLEAIEEMKIEQLNVKADTQFETEFNGMKSLIDAEYPDISEGDLSKIKQQLKDNAFTEEYKKTPLSVIYKGLDGFREAIMTKKKSAESSRSGQNRNSEIQDYSKWTDEDIEKASRKEVEKYFEWVDKNKTS